MYRHTIMSAAVRSCAIYSCASLASHESHESVICHVLAAFVPMPTHALCTRNSQYRIHGGRAREVPSLGATRVYAGGIAGHSAWRIDVCSPGAFYLVSTKVAMFMFT